MFSGPAPVSPLTGERLLQMTEDAEGQTGGQVNAGLSADAQEETLQSSGFEGSLLRSFPASSLSIYFILMLRPNRIFEK